VKGAVADILTYIVVVAAFPDKTGTETELPKVPVEVRHIWIYEFEVVTKILLAEVKPVPETV